MKNKILHLSDTHNHYAELEYRTDVDIVVHTGDAECHTKEDFEKFLEWYEAYPIENKIYVAGNHDIFIERNEKYCKTFFEASGVHYLNKSSITINDLKFYGEPISPRFGNWAFMADRSKMDKHWSHIPEDVNVLLTHSPPKGILDLTETRAYQLEMCGCSALEKRVQRIPTLKLHCFGHIHNFKHVINTGLRIRNGVIFSNAASVEDGRFDKGIIHYGNIIEI